MSGDRRIGPPAEGIVEREVGTEVALYDARGQQVTLLNQTASDIWRLCDGRQTLDEIVDTLAAAYAVEREEIRSDVARTIEQWLAEGLLAAD